MQDNLTDEELDEILGGTDGKTCHFSVDALLMSCSESFDDFINNLDHDPRFKNDHGPVQEDEDDNDGFVEID
jgi:hypothetical protein